MSDETSPKDKYHTFEEYAKTLQVQEWDITGYQKKIMEEPDREVLRSHAVGMANQWTLIQRMYWTARESMRELLYDQKQHQHRIRSSLRTGVLLGAAAGIASGFLITYAILPDPQDYRSLQHQHTIYKRTVRDLESKNTSQSTRLHTLDDNLKDAATKEQNLIKELEKKNSDLQEQIVETKRQRLQSQQAGDVCRKLSKDKLDDICAHAQRHGYRIPQCP